MSTTSADTRSATSTAAYHWPDHDEPVTELSGAGGHTVAVGLLPHSNEPLGYVLPRPGDHLDRPGRIALIGPIDPPPAAHRFPLPCDLYTFLAQGYLPPLAEQAEFAHRAIARTNAQQRAALFRSQLATLAPDALVLVHNDPVARGPYLYANEPWPAVERGVRACQHDPRAPRVLPGVGWTDRIGDLTYALFPCSRLGVFDQYSAGLYTQYELGVPTLTLELPMFAWGAAEQARLAVGRAMSDWIAAGESATASLVRTARAALAGATVPMVPARVNARTLLAALHGVLSELDVRAADRRAGEGRAPARRPIPRGMADLIPMSPERPRRP